MAKEHTVAKASEIGPGGRKVVKVSGTEILVLNHGGTYYALNSECPHEGNSLCDGAINGCAIVCPTHEWEFSLKTGESDDHPGFEATTYPIRVDGGELKVTL